MKYDVCCMGHLCTDILVGTVDEMPPRGQVVAIESARMLSGGCSMNTAIGLARLGVNTTFIGKVGQDGFGNFLEETLVREHVDVSGFMRQPGGATHVSTVLIGSDGERSALYSFGRDVALQFTDIDLSVVENSRYLFIGGIFLTPGFAGEQSGKILRYAQQKGVITMLDTAWDTTGKWMETILSNMQYLDWFVPSGEEAEQLLGTSDPIEMAKQFKGLGVENVVIKLGGEGCYVEPAGEKGTLFGVFPTRMVDTAGAGDAWCAGFLAGMINGMPVDKAAVMGNAVASLCISGVGTTSGIRSYDETLEYIRKMDRGSNQNK